MLSLSTIERDIATLIFYCRFRNLFWRQIFTLFNSWHKTQIPLCERTIILGSLSNQTNNTLLNLMIILGKICIYLKRFGQKFNICNFKQNLFHIRLVESNIAIKVTSDQIVKEKWDKTYV